MHPGAPGGGVGLADGVGEVLEARSGSRDHVLEELEHFALLPRRVSPPDVWSSPIASPRRWVVRAGGGGGGEVDPGRTTRPPRER